jgi:hypothetical protein
MEDPSLEGAAKTRLMARFNSRVAELVAKDAELAELRKERKQRGVVGVPIATRQQALERLLARMGEAEGDELYKLRASVSAALKGVVHRIWVSGKLDEVHPNGMVTSEASIQIQMVGDNRVYLWSPGAERFLAFNIPKGGKVTVDKVNFDGSPSGAAEGVMYPSA